MGRALCSIVFVRREEGANDGTGDKLERMRVMGKGGQMCVLLREASAKQFLSECHVLKWQLFKRLRKCKELGNGG